MVDQLSSFADEVTRVAREVGTEGVLGGQADVKGVSGTWRDLTESVNGMASNLTDQVRQIAERDDRGGRRRPERRRSRSRPAARSRRSPTPSTAWSTSSRRFAAEVTRVAREVGTEGELGGQAEVEGVSGTWKRPDRVGERHGVEPHRPGPLDRRGDHRGRQRRPVGQDHRRGARRGRGARRHAEHDGRPPALVRRRGHPRRPRGRHRGQARRPGRGRGRQRHVEGRSPSR